MLQFTDKQKFDLEFKYKYLVPKDFKSNWYEDEVQWNEFLDELYDYEKAPDEFIEDFKDNLTNFDLSRIMEISKKNLKKYKNRIDYTIIIRRFITNTYIDREVTFKDMHKIKNKANWADIYQILSDWDYFRGEDCEETVATILSIFTNKDVTDDEEDLEDEE